MLENENKRQLNEIHFKTGIIVSRPNSFASKHWPFRLCSVEWIGKTIACFWFNIGESQMKRWHVISRFICFTCITQKQKPPLDISLRQSGKNRFQFDTSNMWTSKENTLIHNIDKEASDIAAEIRCASKLSNDLNDEDIYGDQILVPPIPLNPDLKCTGVGCDAQFGFGRIQAFKRHMIHFCEPLEQLYQSVKERERYNCQ